MDYSDRRLTSVAVWNLEGGAFSETEYRISGTVRLQFSSADGSDVGPAITVDIATDADPSTSIADAEKLLLAKAISLLGRSAKEDAQTAHSALIQERKKAFVKPGEKN